MFVNDLLDKISLMALIWGDCAKIWKPTKTENDSLGLQLDFTTIEQWTVDSGLRQPVKISRREHSGLFDIKDIHPQRRSAPNRRLRGQSRTCNHRELEHRLKLHARYSKGEWNSSILCKDTLAKLFQNFS